jgi:mRNA interferase RelE/StbE
VPDPGDEKPYEIRLSSGVKRALSETLPSTTAVAAWEFIRGPLCERPRAVGTELGPPFQGLWRTRRGQYRVRYRIDETAHRVLVLDVEHRRYLYRS